ncbi:unnamed protein product [Rotaria magnacalcarata]|uniref:Uncharacterized protein n=1 Tax=Rotaria magnacalcarata TaxID=392030 RepID=A0A819DAW6_9BILA|nr:unnamed protein product [Rotaria magnacalcarata]CAF1639872.1 unnamed protein product [Rotaria magnacalcarata]CAF1978666.1 unnamed protein product [Rotaria magnacalcarata]CAF1979464.1 unnamed protein product [Rotaria magnacalcarata]CAF2127723.1 unnamed protein product [Rotaria magnacalcarata]
MKFYLIVLIIYFYIISQTAIDARTARLPKLFWPNSNNHYNQGDLFHLHAEHKRQAGWGKRRYLTMDDDNDDYLLYHQYAPSDYTFHNRFDDK